MYDVYCYNSSSTLACEIGPVWTNDTTPATDVVWTSGRLTKSGDQSRLLVGSFYTTSTTTTEDSVAKRYLSSLYNQVPASMSRVDTTGSWTVSSATFTQANGSSSNQLNFVQSYPVNTVKARVYQVGSSSANNSFGTAGIGVNSTTVNSAPTYGATLSSAFLTAQIADYEAYATRGRNFWAWLEVKTAGGGGGTITFYGLGGTNQWQSGISGTMFK